MAPSPPAVYFSALDKCLNGELSLVSWETANRLFNQLHAGDIPPSLETFLRDDTVKSMLSSPLRPLPAPTPQTKADFDTRTAAIHVQASQDGRYDIDQIKKDALWLSTAAKINEMDALRIVMLDWQRRSATQLLAEWSEEERLSVQKATANANLRASTTNNALAQEAASESQFDKEDNRRTRLLSTLYTEETSILELSASLVGYSLPEDLQPSVPAEDLRSAIPLQTVAKAVWKAQSTSSSEGTSARFFTDVVAALKTRLALLADPEQHPGPRLLLPPGASMQAILAQIVSILRLAFLHLFSLPSVTSAQSVTEWYKLMDESMFLSDLSELPDVADVVILIKCLVGLISLELIKAKHVIQHLVAATAADDAPAYPDLSKTAYWEDDECIRLLTGTVLGAVAQHISHAGPAVLAWSIVSQALRDVASTQRPDSSASDGPRSPQLTRSTSWRDSTGPTNRYDAKLDLIMSTLPSHDDDAIAIMGNAAVGPLQVFETITSMSECLLMAFPANSTLHLVACGKTTLLSLIRDGYPLFQYGPDLVQSVLSVLSYDTVPPNLSHARVRSPAQPVKTLIEDNDMMGARFLDQIQQRYAYELRPFLRCMLSISQSHASLPTDDSQILAMLENMNAFTQLMPARFEGYDLVQEDVIQNCIKLTTHLPIFTPRNRRGQALLLSRGDDDADVLSAVPTGTIGVVVRESKPFVVCWQFRHSALEYLGTLLSTRLTNATLVEATTSMPIDKEAAAEIIALADSLISSAMAVGHVDTAKNILGRLSYGVDKHSDIIRVIFDIFEEELQAQIEQPAAEGSLYLLVHCARLLQTTISIYPERIWSLLSRSNLLSTHSGTGGLAAVVSATELPLGQYDFLRCCIGLYEGLIEDCVRRAVSRKTVTKAVARFEDPSDTPGSTPEKHMGAVLAAFQRIMLDVLQSSASWKFTFASERCEINTRIFNAMHTALDYAYSTDDNSVIPAKLSGVLAPAVDVILSVFLAERPHELTFQPLLGAFASAIADADATPMLRSERLVKDQTVASLTFCSTVLRVGILLNRQAKYLTDNLLRAMPLLARIFAARHYYKAPVADVMTSVVRSLNAPCRAAEDNISGASSMLRSTSSDARRTEAEPASLLGHLGADAMKFFLAVISELDHPLQHLDTEVAIWNMLAAVVSNKQQWLAICLLTGSTPRDKLASKDAAKTVRARGRPLFTYALDQLVKIRQLSPRRAMAILDFVARAQDHWAWATTGIGKHTDLIQNLTDWLADLSPNERPTDMEAVIRTANENHIAALIVDVLARYLHNARQLGDTTTAKLVASKIKHLRDHGVAVDGYNFSLHKNLSKNFETKFPQCSLPKLKRTTLRHADFGREYYYDRVLAGKMLDYEPSWNRRNSQGFVDEVARANVNFSLVESQISLLKSWKALAIGLGAFAEDNTALQKDLATVASNCLKANQETSLPTTLFENIIQIRADLAFILIQRLTLIRSKEPEVQALLPVAWDTVRTCSQDFETATTSRELDYYRNLLRILFLSLQPHIYNALPTPSADQSTSARSIQVTTPYIPALIEILQRVIAPTFRALCTTVHADATTSDPADFVLLTALLQSILRVPGMQSAHATVSAVFAHAGTVRYATNLYSWADQLSLALDSTDPVYGELSVLFLLELSSVPLIAEQMAVEGVLARLSSANLSDYLRKPGGKGPFSEPSRMHSIWTRGFLPLCLNLVEAVGPPIASEIGAFLNSFSAQLARVLPDLELGSPSIRRPYAGSLTLGLAAEAHSLGLIGLILERLRAVGPSAGVNAEEVPELKAFERAGIKEEVEGLLGSRKALRERIVPVGEREGLRAREKSDAAGCETRLEEMVVQELEAALVCLTG